jgi:predicted Rossmann-fold nucleotide-binding protein
VKIYLNTIIKILACGFSVKNESFESIDFYHLMRKLKNMNMNTRLWDLVTPDGYISKIVNRSGLTMTVYVTVNDIPEYFVGFDASQDSLMFNIRSVLAQLGIDAVLRSLFLRSTHRDATIELELVAFGPVAREFLSRMTLGMYVGRIFCALPERLVKSVDYIKRIESHKDWYGRPLLSCGEQHNTSTLEIHELEDRAIAQIPLLPGVVQYSGGIYGLLDTLCLGLKSKEISMRGLLKLHQQLLQGEKKIVNNNDILLVSTQPLCIQSMFGRVAQDRLPEGYRHTSASIIAPTTIFSGNIYELHGESTDTIKAIPMEFYTLQIHREHVYFEDRREIHDKLNDDNLLHRYRTHLTSQPRDKKISTMFFKGSQMTNPSNIDWNIITLNRKSSESDDKITNQSENLFLNAIEKDTITSQGVLISRYFPTYHIKPFLLNNKVLSKLKGLYFTTPSLEYDDYFSYQDRSFLSDLWNVSLPVYWISNNGLLRYVQKSKHEVGFFLPEERHDCYQSSALVGVYGSAVTSDLEKETLKYMLEGIRDIVKNTNKTNYNEVTLVTGGGPGVMEAANKVAKSMGIASCGHVVDFKHANGDTSEQSVNVYLDGIMTYRLDELINRQGNFKLDIALFFPGGIGTDTELMLELVNRKTSHKVKTPIFMFGDESYWKMKLNAFYTANLSAGTLKGSEWISNSVYIVKNNKKALAILKDYYDGTLDIGPQKKYNEVGYYICE